MIVSYSHAFKKMFRKQPATIQNKFKKRLALFMKNPHHPLLCRHALNGEWGGCGSINITGDIRAVFEDLGNDYFEFVAIGSHSELYS